MREQTFLPKIGKAQESDICAGYLERVEVSQLD